MTPLDPRLNALKDELANALQSVVLLVEHLERMSAATARDIIGITIGLKRASGALTRLRGGAR